MTLDFDRTEHVLAKILEVTGDFVETLADDVGRDDRLVAAFAQAFANEILDDAADDRTLRVPKDETAAGIFLDRKKVELDAQLAMVAALRFLDTLRDTASSSAASYHAVP